MEVIREIVDLEKLERVVNIPKNFRCSKAEIIVFPVEETSPKTNEVFVPEKFYGVSSIDNIEKAIREMRDEWNRI